MNIRKYDQTGSHQGWIQSFSLSDGLYN